MNIGLIGVMALVAAAGAAGPASAQAVVSYPEVCAQFYPNANCQNLGEGSPYTGSYQRGLAASGGRDPVYRSGIDRPYDRFDGRRKSKRRRGSMSR